MGRWLKDQLQKRRNTVRFLLPRAGSANAFHADGAVRDQVQVAATYKRPSEAEAGQWVIGDYFATDWLLADAPRAPLPVALDLDRLYEQILRQLAPVPAWPGETMAAPD